MPITELVIGAFRPEVAKEGLAAFRTSVPKYFSSLQGLLFQRTGHILRHNGEEISGQYRGMLAIEWDKPESFHAFYPASEVFGAFIGSIKPFMGGKPTPQLFNPSSAFSRSNHTFEGQITHIFTGKVSKKDEISGEWDKLVAVMEEELKGEMKVNQWSGWGIEETEGVWVGIMGGDDAEKIVNAVGKDGVVRALKRFRELGEIDDYVVNFEG